MWIKNPKLVPAIRCELLSNATAIVKVFSPDLIAYLPSPQYSSSQDPHPRLHPPPPTKLSQRLLDVLSCYLNRIPLLVRMFAGIFVRAFLWSLLRRLTVRVAASATLTRASITCRPQKISVALRVSLASRENQKPRAAD